MRISLYGTLYQEDILVRTRA